MDTRRTSRPPTEAFDDFFAEHYASMVRLATLLADRQPIAEELVQDSFRRLWQRWETIDDPLPYLRRAVVNACRGELRKRRVRRLHPDPPPTDDRPEHDYLLDVVSTLPARRRTALVLRFYGGLSFPEIAEAMGISTGTAKSTVHRALADLRSELS